MDEKNLVVIREFNGKYKINQDYKPIAEKWVSDIRCGIE